MHSIDFDAITVPTPAAYDAADPHKQRENLAYVLNQALGQLTGEIDIDAVDAIDALSVSGEVLQLPGFRVTRAGRVLSLVIDP